MLTPGTGNYPGINPEDQSSSSSDEAREPGDNGTERSPNGRSFSQWFYGMLHARDIYAKPITLVFNKKPAF